MELKYEYGTIKSKKTGAEYQGIYVTINDEYNIKKFIILSDVEKALLKQQENKMVKPSDFPFEK